jgi:hypothetical protein
MGKQKRLPTPQQLIEAALAHYRQQGIPEPEVTAEAMDEYARDVLHLSSDDVFAVFGTTAERNARAMKQALIIWRASKLGGVSVSDIAIPEDVRSWVEKFERDRFDEDPEWAESIAYVDAALRQRWPH